jgi:hypothetical protein
MKKLSLIAALLLGASPVAAQSVQQPLGTSGEINNSTLTNTGVICVIKPFALRPSSFDPG